MMVSSACPHASEPRPEELTAGGRFEVGHRLGSGTFGTVYAAYDRSRDEPVALKTLRIRGADAVQELKHEFRALADLAHPNLVGLHELLWSGECPVLVMDLVEGCDFLHWVRGAGGVAGACDADRLRHGFMQLADALTVLHRSRKLHRDIKPANVLVTTSGRVVLLDFGLAAEVPRHPRAVIPDWGGTYAYMSPEQALGSSLTPASDWYSAGVMLHQALTGRLPRSFAPRDDVERLRGEPAVPADLAELCGELLQRDPGARADGRRVAARLAPALLGVAAGSVQPDAYVARIEELDALAAAFDRVLAGGLEQVFVAGASGIGKSELVARFLDQALARRPDAMILSGRCYEHEAVPYKALDGIVERLSEEVRTLQGRDREVAVPPDLDALGRLFPGLAEALGAPMGGARLADTADETRRRACNALRALLHGIAAGRPLILFVDDLHWGDVDSVILLSEVLRGSDPPNLLLIGTFRTEEIARSPFIGRLWALQEELASSARATLLTVPPLSPEEGEALALALLGGGETVRDRARSIAHDAQGNPFVVSALVEVANTRMLAVGLPGASVQQTAARFGEGFDLTALMALRAALLPRDARFLLEILSVAGQPIPRRLAARACDLGGEFQPALAVLRGARLLRMTSAGGTDRLEPFHDRVREAMLSLLSPDAQRRRHAALAGALEAAGSGDSELLARHFHGAGDEARAGRYAVQAGDRALAALAFDRAGRMYALALETGSLSGAGERAVRAKLGDALGSAGNSVEASRHYLAAAEGEALELALEWRRRAAQALLGSGHVGEGMNVVRSVIHGVGLRFERSDRLAMLYLIARRMLVRAQRIRFVPRAPEAVPAHELTQVDTCWSVAGMLSWLDTVRGGDFQAQHMLIALRCGEPCRVTRALALEASYSATGGKRTMRRTARLLEACRQTAAYSDDPYADAISVGGAAAVAYLQGRWREAIAGSRYADAIYRDRCQNVAWERSTCQFFILSALLYLGEWHELSERVTAIVQAARLRGDLLLDTHATLRFATLKSLLDDDVAQAREVVDQIRRRLPTMRYNIQHFYAFHEGAQVELYAGDAERAWREVEAGWRAMSRAGILLFQNTRVEALGIRARTALARAACAGVPGSTRRRLLRRASRTARRIARESLPFAPAMSQLLAAGVASIRGRRSEAAALLERAAEGFARAEMAAHAAVARGRLAGMLGHADAARAADAVLTAQGVRNPERVAAMMAPGFAPGGRVGG